MMAGLLLKLLLSGLLLVVVVLAIVRAGERAEARGHEQRVQDFRRWQAWHNQEPNPASTLYSDWNTGGGERFQRDMARHNRRREHYQTRERYENERF